MNITKEQSDSRLITRVLTLLLTLDPLPLLPPPLASGLAGFTKTLALEVAQQNITCNAICPG